MTTMALTAPPLKRLFERLDFSPTPTQKVFETGPRAMEVGGSRDGRALTVRREVPGSERGREENFRLPTRGRRTRLHTGRWGGGQRNASWALRRTSRLRAAKNRRQAVRLRRLFDEARRCGQPVLAQFTLVEEGRDRAAIEILAAPLSENGTAIDSILCAVSISPFESAPLAHSHEAPTDRDLAIFALGSSRSLGQQVARHLHAELSPHEESEFEDGEHKMRPLVNVRDRDVYVIYVSHGDESQSGADKLCRLLFFIGTLKDAGAARVTAVVPYLCYARKDRQTKPRDPVTTRYVAQLFEAVGTDRVIVLDVHNHRRVPECLPVRHRTSRRAGSFRSLFCG